MAHDRWRRSGVWKERIARKRYERLLRLDDKWLALLAMNDQLIAPETKPNKRK